LKPDHAFFMEEVERMASRSSCCKIHVGAILVLDTHIISTGYNGTPRGDKNCDQVFVKEMSRKSLGEEKFLDLHKTFSTRHEIHAEKNCVIDALLRGTTIQNAILYCSYSPCFDCSKLLLRCGIKEVFYKETYDLLAVQWLQEHGIKIEKLS